MNNEDVTNCSQCGHPVIGAWVWNQLPKPRRARKRTRDGRCLTCVRREKHVPKPRKPKSAEYQGDALIYEYRFVMDYNAAKFPTRAAKVRYAAERIGVTADALDRALYRHGVTV